MLESNFPRGPAVYNDNRPARSRQATERFPFPSNRRTAGRRNKRKKYGLGRRARANKVVTYEKKTNRSPTSSVRHFVPRVPGKFETTIYNVTPIRIASRSVSSAKINDTPLQSNKCPLACEPSTPYRRLSLSHFLSAPLIPSATLSLTRVSILSCPFHFVRVTVSCVFQRTSACVCMCVCVIR